MHAFRCWIDDRDPLGEALACHMLPLPSSPFNQQAGVSLCCGLYVTAEGWKCVCACVFIELHMTAPVMLFFLRY